MTSKLCPLRDIVFDCPHDGHTCDNLLCCMKVLFESLQDEHQGFSPEILAYMFVDYAFEAANQKGQVNLHGRAGFI